MPKNTNKQNKFVWKHRKESGVEISADSIKEIKNNLDYFNEKLNCSAHNISNLNSDLAQLESCTSEKIDKNTILFSSDLSNNNDSVETNRFDSLCNLFRQTKNTTDYNNVETSAFDIYRGSNKSERYAANYAGADVSVNTPAGWAADNAGAYRYAIYGADYGTNRVSAFGVDKNVKSCTGYYASDACTSVYFSKYTSDYVQNTQNSNTDKSV